MIRVGSRKSPLAIAQTEEVLSQLRLRFPDEGFPVVTMETAGDRKKNAALLSLGRGTFSKEIERALLEGEIDLAVHSAKDLTATLPEGLALAGIVARKDPRDALVNRWDASLSQLPRGARIGTSSPRRAAQLKALRLDLRVLPIRGNVGTRLDKAGGSEYDGVVLAAAGLVRLGRQAEIAEYLAPESFTPEVGQGTLAVEVRVGDTRTVQILDAIDHRPSSTALKAERSFVQRLGGGCKVPVAAYARLVGREIRILAMAGLPDGGRIFRADVRCDAGDPVSAGIAAAEALLAEGAGEIVGPD